MALPRIFFYHFSVESLAPYNMGVDIFQWSPAIGSHFSRKASTLTLAFNPVFSFACTPTSAPTPTPTLTPTPTPILSPTPYSTSAPYNLPRTHSFGPKVTAKEKSKSKSMRDLHCDALDTRWGVIKCMVFVVLTFSCVSCTPSSILTYSYLGRG